MKTNSVSPDFYGKEKISKILFKIAPPVMLSQLIISLYNIVDSFFIGMYSDDALTALSVIYPLQLIIIALAVGMGVGVNTYMAKQYAQDQNEDAERTAGTGMVISVFMWVIFAVISVITMRSYVMTSATSPLAIDNAVTYGNIVCIGSLGIFLESNWTKVHQARGNMKRPMVAQISGALTNIVLDPLLIFTCNLGIAGAAYATIIGQFVAAFIVAFNGIRKPPELKKIGKYIKNIFYFGYSNIVMQALYTVYIVALNIILATFTDSAVTVLGLYYKLQSFFFIPLFGLHTCIVPVLSYNYTRKYYKRCKSVMNECYLVSSVFMIAGMIAFIIFPDALISMFSKSEEVHEIGRIAFPIIGSGFISAVFGLTMPVFFQAVGKGIQSSFLSILRQIMCLIPIFWAFSLIGLNYTWIAFPISETFSGLVGLIMYFIEVRKWKNRNDEVFPEMTDETNLQANLTKN